MTATRRWTGVLAYLDDHHGLDRAGAGVPPHRVLPLPLCGQDNPLAVIGAVDAVWLAGDRVLGAGRVDTDSCGSLTGGFPVAAVLVDDGAGWQVERVVLTLAPNWPGAVIRLCD